LTFSHLARNPDLLRIAKHQHNRTTTINPMNPLASIIALFASMKADLTARFNAALSSRPPLEAVEGANIANGLLREFDYTKERLERAGVELNATLAAAASIIPGFEYKPGEDVEVAAARLLEKMQEDTASKAITAAIAAKTHLPMEDHTSAVELAAETARTEERTKLEGEFATRLDEVKLLAERRTAVIEKIGAVASASLSDADLLAEDHEARLAKIETRVGELAAVGITPDAKPKSFASLMACGTDEPGETEFASRLETIKEAAGGNPIDIKASAPKPSTVTGVMPSGAPETKKKAVI
jgi:hypothetical protein